MTDKKKSIWKFWRHMLSYYSTNHSNLSQLARIIFTASGGTSPLEILVPIICKSNINLLSLLKEQKFILKVLVCTWKSRNCRNYVNV